MGSVRLYGPPLRSAWFVERISIVGFLGLLSSRRGRSDGVTVGAAGEAAGTGTGTATTRGGRFTNELESQQWKYITSTPPGSFSGVLQVGHAIGSSSATNILRGHKAS